jgi:plastocyanin
MPRKGKKRREAHRERKLERAEATPLSSEEEVARLARAKAKAEHEAERLRRKAHREDSGAGVNPWYVGLPIGGAAVAGIIVLGVVLLGGGGGGEATPSPTRDPRLGTATPAATLAMEARGEESGSTFVPDTLTIDAGKVVEIVVNNTAQNVSHNLRVSGEDGEYATDDPKNLKDDWVIPIIEKGQTGRLELMMNKPGSYKFQCDFHPQTQKGTLIVQ